MKKIFFVLSLILEIALIYIIFINKEVNIDLTKLNTWIFPVFNTIYLILGAMQILFKGDSLSERDFNLRYKMISEGNKQDLIFEHCIKTYDRLKDDESKERNRKLVQRLAEMDYEKAKVYCIENNITVIE